MSSYPPIYSAWWSLKTGPRLGGEQDEFIKHLDLWSLISFIHALEAEYLEVTQVQVARSRVENWEGINQRKW